MTAVVKASTQIPGVAQYRTDRCHIWSGSLHQLTVPMATRAEPAALCVWFTTNSAALFLKQMGNSRGKTALTPIEKQSLFQQSVHKVFANISLLKSTVKPSLSVTHHTCALSCWNLKYCKKTCGIHSAL